ncbi:Crp/Fnr family transcriptional regulator [Allopusillimonas ginsengisoli]|uniref:Crp/Fnr family transcriptional regulator n=1 Tax=Allopusillimonas ginsengisoli TaxID=453575 RepID=UPI0010C22306|nr:Crp/Fnr family transcriptional regulator [Allopusillimonas ginsengisoli]
MFLTETASECLLESTSRDRHSKRINRGEIVFRAGACGTAWLILQGAARLDHGAQGGSEGWASLAVAGDIIGAGVLLRQDYTHTATALTSCVIRPWLPGETKESKEALLQALVRAEHRVSEAVLLRSGTAQQRIHRFLALLGDMPLELPTLQDTADMTGLTKETVSRTVSAMAQTGLIGLTGKQRAQFVVSIA